MKKLVLTFALFSTFLSLKADVVFQSFVVGDDFGIGNFLEWVTVEEIDNDIFKIEKSTDGGDFVEIGEVKGIGNSADEQKYTFLDLNARKGRSLYRIRQVDVGGDQSFSHTVVVNKESENKFMVARIINPLNSSSVELQIDAIEDVELKYSIRDMKGDVLQEETMFANAGLSNIVFDLKAYADGPYKLALVAGDEEEMITIRKSSNDSAKPPVASKN